MDPGPRSSRIGYREKWQQPQYKKKVGPGKSRDISFSSQERERVMNVGLQIYHRAPNFHIFSFHVKGKFADETDMSCLGRKITKQ